MAKYLEMFIGDNLILNATILMSNGTTPLDLTGSSLTFTIKNPNKSVLVIKSIGNGIVVPVPSNGLATITISPSDTSGLSFVGVYNTTYEFKLITPSGQIFTLEYGTLRINNS